LPLGSRADSLFAGIAAIDRDSGRLLGTLRLAPVIEELFDFVVMPGFQRPLVLDPSPDAQAIGIETPTGSYWMAAGTDLQRVKEVEAGGKAATVPEPST